MILLKNKYNVQINEFLPAIKRHDEIEGIGIIQITICDHEEQVEYIDGELVIDFGYALTVSQEILTLRCLDAIADYFMFHHDQDIYILD